MLLGFFRDVVCSVVFHAALLYAANIALQQRVRIVDSKGRPDRVRVSVRALKLWIMIMSITALSALGADAIPLFTELKIIAVFLLVLAPSFTQQEIYDRLFAPFIESAAVAAKSVTSSEFLVFRGGWWAANCCVYAAVGITNLMQKRGVLHTDEVNDIQSGLVFAQRALHDVMDRYLMQHPEEKPRRSTSLRLNSGNNVCAAPPSTEDDLVDETDNMFSSPSGVSAFGKADVRYASHHSHQI